MYNNCTSFYAACHSVIFRCPNNFSQQIWFFGFDRSLYKVHHESFMQCFWDPEQNLVIFCRGASWQIWQITQTRSKTLTLKSHWKLVPQCIPPFTCQIWWSNFQNQNPFITFKHSGVCQSIRLFHMWWSRRLFW